MGFFIFRTMRKFLYLLGLILLGACGSAEVRTVDSNAAAQAKNQESELNDSSEVTSSAKTNLKQTPSSEKVKEIVSPSSVEKHIEYLASDALEGRATGSKGIEAAAVYIEKQLKSAGVKPYFETYRDSFDAKGKNAFNIVGVIEGSDPELKKEYVIVGAHYDHIGNGKPVEGDTIANGANDNASGTSAVIELAKYFSKAKNNKRSIIFTLYAGEEMGLLGSKHLAQRLKEDGVNLYTMFNIEMIGVPMVNKDYLVYLTGYENSNMADKFNSYSGKQIMGFLPKAKEYSLFMRSDNYSFYEQFKIPAQTVSTFDFTNFDYYHQVGDEPQRMDYGHIANVINNLIPGLEKMVNTPEKEIIWNEKK